MDKKNTGYPEYFMGKDKAMDNMDDVVDGFDKFSVDVVPDLAWKMNYPETNEVLDTDLWDRNTSSIFLRAVEEKEITDTVR